MSTLWFSNYYGDPSRFNFGRHGANKLFATQIQVVRDHFKLTKQRVGLETGQDWIPYTLLGDNVEVCVTRFEWGDFEMVGDNLTPRMLIKFQMRKKDVYYPPTPPEPVYTPPPPIEEPIGAQILRSLQEIAPSLFGQPKPRPVPPPPPPRPPRRPAPEPVITYKVYYNESMTVRFPVTYPNKPPIFRLNKQEIIDLGTSHHHHLLGNGVLCILGDDEDWNRDTDNLLSGFNAALSWCHLHYRNYGW